MVFRRKQRALPLAEGGAAGPQVNADVEDLTLQHAHQLGLRVVDLEMQAAQHALGRGGLVVLHEVHIYAAGNEVRPLVGFHEVAACVTVLLVVHNQHAVDGGLGEGEVAGSDAFHLCDPFGV